MDIPASPSKNPSKSKKAVNFEQALEQLETLVDDMESGDLSLEHSLKAFEKGIKLTRDCQVALTEAEQKVQVLIEENDQLSALDFDEEDEDDE